MYMIIRDFDVIKSVEVLKYCLSPICEYHKFSRISIH